MRKMMLALSAIAAMIVAMPLSTPANAQQSTNDRTVMQQQRDWRASQRMQDLYQRSEQIHNDTSTHD
jgi:hypothetical protein